jgi:hypothetical protein
LGLPRVSATWLVIAAGYNDIIHILWKVISERTKPDYDSNIPVSKVLLSWELSSSIEFHRNDCSPRMEPLPRALVARVFMQSESVVMQLEVKIEKQVCGITVSASVNGN